ncbi:hypothetical protein BDZ89DRAFT_1142107 [Hymenopellis radicata]|nr:hypothetical protein BDZ89DRAFT_1142107 [Hymenopellis radicata]
MVGGYTGNITTAVVRYVEVSGDNWILARALERVRLAAQEMKLRGLTELTPELIREIPFSRRWLKELKARESLLTPNMCRSVPKSSLNPSTARALYRHRRVQHSRPTPPVPKKDAASPFSPIPMVQATNATLMERTILGIDDAKEDDEDEDGLGLDHDTIGGFGRGQIWAVNA